jgi:hypothetical protein
MSDHGLPEEASRDQVSAFYDTLVAMETGDLKKLEIATYPKWARRVIDAERCRRKAQAGTDTALSSEERKRIVAVGTHKSQGQRSEKEKKEKKKRMARGEVDGEHLHDAVAEEAPFSLVYDTNLLKDRKERGVRFMVGTFTCTHCSSKKPHAWISGKIATQLWFDNPTDRYRVLVNCQKCNRCNRYTEPVIDEDKYSKKVVDAITLWKGLRERGVGSRDRKKTGPHDETRCRGCEKGICEWSSEDPLH